MRALKATVAGLSAHPTIAAVGLTLVVTAIFVMLTPRIAFNDGLGNDGTDYANLTLALRGEPAEAPWAGFAYRLLPSALVAVMPFEVVTGFLVVNVLAVLGSAILLVRLLARYEVSPTVRLLALFWWLCLPMAVRWDVYYPVLGDAFGFFAVLVLIVCALERRLVLFAIALVAGVLARENLVVAIPFLWRTNLRSTPWRWTLVVALVSVPTIAALFLIRAFPPVEPSAGSDPLSQSVIVASQIAWIIQNRFGEAWRVLLAGPVSLGLLLLIPLIRFREALRFLSREMHWLYFGVATVVFSVIGGRDTDRYLYVLAPLLLVLTFGVHGDLWRSWPRATALTVLQLVALRAGWPTGTTEHDYLQYTTGFMELDRLAAIALVVALTSVVAGLIVWSAPRSGRGSGEATVRLVRDTV
jgi:hypothetical protein